MFDFEKLRVYTESKIFNKRVTEILTENNSINIFFRDQLKRSSMSIVLNIAEGTGRFTKADKRHFYIISRGSLYESISILNILNESKVILDEDYKFLYERGENISKMLMGLIKSL